MIKSILLSVDGSTYTNAQVKYCVQLAKAFKSKVNVLSVVDIRIFEWAVVMGTEGFVPLFPSTAYKEESKNILETKATAVLDKCSTILTKEKVDFELEKIPGSPADVIYEKSHLVDLLVIGVRGEFAKWKRNLVGATLDAVIRQCNKPLLITTQKYKRISKILFAYDGSDKANKALQLAGFFATNLKVPIIVLSVHDNSQVRNRFLQEANTYFAPYKMTADLVGISGDPEKEIIRVSQDNDCDMIVMGAFGHSRIREAILGSTTEEVVRNAKIPVLLAK